MKDAATSMKKLTKDQQKELLGKLESRFEGNMGRHIGIRWADVQAKLTSSADRLWSAYQMEATGGEPDVVSFDQGKGEYIICDCSKESPEGRRNTCYDQTALESRKQSKPPHSAVGMAETMGIALLTEDEYRALQELGEFDTRTSSWVKTPDMIRRLGGALFCDRRYETVFVYHNGAESYYGARGFRGLIRI